MRFRLETTDAASTKTDIAVTPALPSIEHQASSITHSKISIPPPSIASAITTTPAQPVFT
jgi:hypothetical protein